MVSQLCDIDEFGWEIQRQHAGLQLQQSQLYYCIHPTTMQIILLRNVCHNLCIQVSGSMHSHTCLNVATCLMLLKTRSHLNKQLTIYCIASYEKFIMKSVYYELLTVVGYLYSKLYCPINFIQKLNLHVSSFTFVVSH